MLMTLLLLVGGLVLLTLGAESLVRGSSTFARRLGIPSLIVGLTVVAFGTSAPEMAVSVKAAINGQADLAIGNVVGSNIFNVLFILGASALVVPLAVSRQLLRIDVPFMIAISVLFFVLAMDGKIGMVDGAIFTAGIVGYTAMQIVLAKRERSKASEEEPLPPLCMKGVAGDAFFTVLGLGGLMVGANFFNTGAIQVARALGVSELVIGLTIVAAGTSLPEVAASLMASFRGERDIAVGNVVGSNIFNILAVLGFSSVASGDVINVAASALRFDIPVMILVAAICLPIFLSGRVISRVEGVIFLVGYVAYTTLLVMTSSNSPWTGTTQSILLFGAFPLGLVLIAVEFFRRGQPTTA